MPLMNARTLRPLRPLDGLAERRDLGVLKQQAQIAQALVLAQPAQAALRGRERLLERDEQDVGTCPLRARLRRAAAELILVDAHHLGGDRAQHALLVRAVGRLRIGLPGVHGMLPGGRDRTRTGASPVGAFASRARSGAQSAAMATARLRSGHQQCYPHAAADRHDGAKRTVIATSGWPPCDPRRAPAHKHKDDSRPATSNSRA